DFRRGAPFLSFPFDRLADAVRKRKLLRVDLSAQHRGALLCDRAVKLVGRIGEQSDTILDEFSRDGIERDAGSFELGEDVLGFLDVFLEAVAQLAVIAEGLKRRR